MGTKLTVAFVLLGAGLAWANDWDDAKRKADDFDKKSEEVRRVKVEQSKNIVKAICAASSQDDRKSAAQGAVGDARSRVSERFREAENLEKETVAMLDKLGSREAASRKSEIEASWAKTKDGTSGLRDGRSKLADWMIEQGGRSVRDHADRCSTRDYSVGGNRAACLVADGCKVVEFAPDNGNAVSNAKDRARRIQSALTGDGLKELIRSRSEFSKCEKFEVQVDCYKQCPDINEDGSFRESSASWRSGC